MIATKAQLQYGFDNEARVRQVGDGNLAIQVQDGTNNWAKDVQLELMVTSLANLLKLETSTII